MLPISENTIERLTIEELQALGWQYLPGAYIAPGAEASERNNFAQVVLTDRLRKAVGILNPQIPAEAREQAMQHVMRLYSTDLLHANETFHQMLTEGVKIPYQQDGFERSHEVALIDFADPFNNEYLAVNQFTIIENNLHRRADVVLFINGLPLVVVELKNAVSENARLINAFHQVQAYTAAIPSLFFYNAFCIISDGHDCRAGTISADFSRFMAWKTVDGVKEASRFRPEIETLVRGMLNHATLLDLVRNFIVFEKNRKEDAATGLTHVVTEKKLAAYHQYYAVNKAVQSTIEASGENGNRKGGVVWHTQGSGKSLSMVFYAARLITAPAMQNPTILVITDRNDLDHQLFGTFASARQLLRQEPVQAEDRKQLKELLKVSSGGIVFTTIQKFLPEEQQNVYELLSERKNIIVIADEAHRTQYGFEAKVKHSTDKTTGQAKTRISYGFAKYLRDALPHATYIGFTGTPIESTDINTPQVFGQYIDVYDIAQAVADGATRPIYYESRLARVMLSEEGKKLIAEFDEELEYDEEISESQKAKAKWTKLEAIVGNEDRIRNLAADIVQHFENRESVLKGKGMIVAMSRRIAAMLYNEIIQLRPRWHSDQLHEGAIKVVMTTTDSDPDLLKPFKTTIGQRKTLAGRMKDPNDPLKLVIVRDMWLTGFDAPSLHTMYIDKPMRGHNLMQAIARVNRVFKDKPGGLVVDYLGIATDLKMALSFYAQAGGKGAPARSQEMAVEMMVEKFETVQQFFNEEAGTRQNLLVAEPQAYYLNSFKFNYRRFFHAAPADKLSIILQAEEHILGLQNGKERFIREVTLLSQAFALSVPHEKAMEIKDDVAFFQAVRARLVKFEINGAGKSDVEIETAINQIVSEALQSDKVIDIFEAAGINKPEISKLGILSDEFLQEVKGMKHENLALELLKKLLNDDIKTRFKTNVVKSRKLLEMLEASIRRYQNNLLTTAEIIQELINMAHDMREMEKEGQRMGLREDELAFYNALEENESAVQVLGDEVLKEIAREIAHKVKANATIDWTIRESARAKLIVIVRRTLNKYHYPPDKQEKAIDTVLKQAKALADHWTAIGN